MDKSELIKATERLNRAVLDLKEVMDFLDTYACPKLDSLEDFLGKAERLASDMKTWGDQLNPEHWVIIRWFPDENVGTLKVFYPALTKTPRKGERIAANVCPCNCFFFPAKPGLGEITLKNTSKDTEIVPLQEVFQGEQLSPEVEKNLLKYLQIRFQRNFSAFQNLTVEMWIYRLKGSLE